MRGPRVESLHRGAVAVVDGDGGRLLEIGDVAAPGLPALRRQGDAGAAARRERRGGRLRLRRSRARARLRVAFRRARPSGACGARCSPPSASTTGRSNAAATGPRSRSVLIRQARSGAEPTALYNNCSGKHSGFLCTCRHLGIDHSGYVGLRPSGTGDDPRCPRRAHRRPPRHGCLRHRRLLDPDLRDPARPAGPGALRGWRPAPASAASAPPPRGGSFAACMAEPFFVAGTDRFCTRLMELAPGRIFAKTGAEGVFCAALPEEGIGIALKCDDGATRAAECMVAATLARHVRDEDLASRLDAHGKPRAQELERPACRRRPARRANWRDRSAAARFHPGNGRDPAAVSLGRACEIAEIADAEIVHLARQPERRLQGEADRADQEHPCRKVSVLFQKKKTLPMTKRKAAVKSTAVYQIS